MRQIVLLKDIPDLTESKLDTQTRAPIVKGVKRRISEVDKRALEATLRLKEKAGGELVALSMGDDQTKTALLEALAMGADAAYIVDDPRLRDVDTNATSRVLEAAIGHIGEYDLIVAGEMTLDSLSSQIGPRLAQLLGIPQITYVKEFDVVDGKVRAVRDLEDVDEVVEASLPAVVCVVREIHEPRIPNLMSIMRAKKKPQTVWAAEDIGLDASEVKEVSFVEVMSATVPKVERKQVRIEAETVEATAAKLVEALAQEGVI